MTSTAATSALSWHVARTGRFEPRYVTVLKAALYAGSIALYLASLSSVPGIVAAIITAVGGMMLARFAFRHYLRVGVAVALAALLLAGGLFVGEQLLGSPVIASWLGSSWALITADVITFGLAAFGAVFLLRVLAHRARVLSLLEVAFVVGSVVSTLASHRDRMVNRPRFFSDWAWSMGIDPTTVLVGIGATVSILAVFLFLRDQPLLKLLSTVALLLLLGLLFFLIAEKRIQPARAADALGLTGKNKEGSGGGQKNPFKDDYDPSGPPQPVAVAILRDDFDSDDGVLYFRQRALSKYNGHHLVAAEEVDSDVLSTFPRSSAVLKAAPVQDPAHHLKVPTTMYLLVDHPQPPALTHAQRLALIDNPNPKRFVAAYEVVSAVPAVAPQRLLGRRSIPGSWSAAQRQHYTKIPDDPRYRTLSDIVLREMDPRFYYDDLARAYAIKRFLEREGFYTRKSTHADKRDPTASFLFGSLHGYCVHFAHAAVYLFRSQGIAARVALGYAVQTMKRSGGSSVLIMGDRAHAWPEIHLEGVGWVTFDIHPERTDMPPPLPVDYDLEKLLGELARRDPTGGLSPEGRALRIPWAAIGRSLLLVGLGLVLLGYAIKLARRWAPIWRRGPARCRARYVATLDRLSDLKASRRYGETREAHAARLRALVPSLEPLTRAHLALALGSASPLNVSSFDAMARAARADLAKNVSWARRLLGLLDPFGWLRTR